MGDDMQLGINNTQTQLEINNSAKKQENELKQIYNFLATEGLSIDEAKQLVSKIDEMYQELTTLNKNYSISDFSAMARILFDNDNYFDDNFMMCLLEEVAQTSLTFGQLYSKFSSLN